jgi:GT2 family glycosyltransferase
VLIASLFALSVGKHERGAKVPRPGQKAQVVALVVTHNSDWVLPGLVASLAAGFEGVDRYQVVIVDNASTDSTLEVASERIPEARVVRLPENRGFAAAINAGLAQASPSEAVLVLNPDIRLRPGAVARLLHCLEMPGTGIAVPRIQNGDGRLEWSLRREPTVLRALGEAVLGGGRAGRFPALGELVSRDELYENPMVADWATGAAMLISRRCLDAVGTWDERFFLYSEETDFALRARDKSFVLRYAPDAEVVHLGGEASESPRLWSILSVNRVRLYRSRHSSARSGLFWVAVVLNEALRSPRGPTHRAALSALLRRHA